MATVSSILCGQKWESPRTDQWSISFNKGGTGRLVCRIEFSIFIDAEIEWEPADKSFHDQLISSKDEVEAGDGMAEACLATFDLIITLTKRRPVPITCQVNEDRLTEAAFQPKKYTIRLETGVFGTTYYSKHIVGPNFRLRLTFDISPFPPCQEWKASKVAHVQKTFWEQCQFLSGTLGSLC